VNLVWPGVRFKLVVMAEKRSIAAFVEPMLLRRTEKLPEGHDWLYELKFDGYRALAIKSGGMVRLRSRNDNDFNARYSSITDALSGLADDTVIDGEIVAFDADGKPSFNILQNYGSAGTPLHFFVFDLLVLNGRDLMAEPLVKRRDLLEKRVLPKLSEPVRYWPELKASLKDLIQSVKAQGLGGPSSKTPG
jgi:bifunctional non-homologous end joining protein LigD